MGGGDRQGVPGARAIHGWQTVGHDRVTEHEHELELMVTFYFNVSTKYTEYKGLCLHLESDLNGIMYASLSSQPIISDDGR